MYYILVMFILTSQKKLKSQSNMPPLQMLQMFPDLREKGSPQ